MKSFLSILRSRRRNQSLTWSDPKPRRPDDGPDDLEEIWRRMTRQLRAMLPGRPPINGAPLKGSGGIVLGAAAVILVAIWLFTGIYTVPEGAAAVVSQFGAYRYTNGAGLWYHLPAPFQSVELVSLAQSRSVDVGRNSPLHASNLKDESMLTADENIIDVRFSVQYRVGDAAEFVLNNVHSAAGSEADDAVTQAGESAIREIVGQQSMNQMFSEGPGRVEGQLQHAIQVILDSYKTGLIVTGVTMHPVQAPDQVQAAFVDASNAAQDRERQKSEGQAYANDVIPRARGDAARILANAEGYRSEVVANAQGDADRFKQVLAEYTKAPAVTRQRMYLQTMQAILANTTKVLVDTRSNSTINLNIERSTRDAASGVATSAATSTTATVPAAAPATSTASPAAPAFPNMSDADRARDPAHAREREQR